MSEYPAPPELSPALQPRLAPGVRLVHNKAREQWVLLAPERVFEMNGPTLEILQRCTGDASIAGIIDELAVTFSAPRERIAADVTALLQSLAEKRLVEW